MKALGSVALVTGGAGFIGSHLCAKLAGAGMTVHSVSRREHPGTPAVRHHRADLTDGAAVWRLIDELRPDQVFHLAGHVQGAQDLAHVMPAFHSIVQTTVNLLTAVAACGCRRLVLAGSFMEPTAQALDAAATSPYAAAKAAASGYARMFATTYGVPVSTARVFMVYGPGQHDLAKLVPYTIRCALRGEAPAVSSGRRLVDWVYVDDVVEGLVKLALAGDMGGQTVDIGSGSQVAISDIVNRICHLIDPSIAPAFGVRADRAMEPTGTARAGETLRAIGWAPQIGLDEGLARTIAFYRGNEMR